MGRFDGFLNEASAARTEFLETCQCIGIVIKKSDLSKLIKFYNSPTQEEASEIKDIIIDNVSSYYDWNSKGVQSIKKINAKTEGGMKSLMDAIPLIWGMNVFVDDVVTKKLGKSLYFIHGQIEDYYKIEKEIMGEIEGAKKNTADCIITNVPVEKLFELLETEKISIGNGFVKVGKSKFMQVSLKKSESGAQLGKVTKFLTSLGLSVGTMQAVQALESTQPPILYEGIFDVFKKIAGDVWENLKSMVNKVASYFSSFYQKVFNSKPKQEYIDDLFEDFEEVPEGVISEGVDDMTKTHVMKLWHNRAKIYQKINKEMKRLEKMGDNRVYTNFNYINKIPVWRNKNVEAFTLVSNYLTIRTLQEMVGNSKSLSKIVGKLVAEMFFGGTSLPLWKVYGFNGSGNAYEYLGTVETYIKNMPKKRNIEILGIRINIVGAHYAIMIAMLEKIDDEGKYYVILRTGTNSSNHFSFIFEGSSVKGPLPVDESLEDVL